MNYDSKMIWVDIGDLFGNLELVMDIIVLKNWL